MLKEMASGNLRRMLDRNQTFKCADIAIGDSAIFFNQISRKSTPKWRGPAIILGIGETGATAKFQSQAFKITRSCSRKRIVTLRDSPVGTRDVEERLRNGRRNDEPMDVEVPTINPAQCPPTLRPQRW